MGKDSNTWKAKCIDVGYGGYWNLGDIITVEDDMVKLVTDCNGNIDIQNTEILKGERIIGIKDLNFRISGEWEIIANEPQPSVSDPINPQHYKNCSIECIDSMIMAFGSEFVYHFCICNAWKYMWRYQNKNGVEDIKKSRWYINKASELIPEYLEWQNINYILIGIEMKMIERGELS